MSNLISVGTAVPKYEVSQAEVKEFISSMFSDTVPEISRLLSIFDNSAISRRYLSVPLQWLERSHSFPERNEKYRSIAAEISKEAIANCLEKANADSGNIDCIIFASSTGLTTPTIDAILFNELKLKPHVSRLPIWGLGCAAGAVGLTRAFEYTKAYPGRNVLLVSVELCSLTFQREDTSKSNLVAASLFSDGAAAVLVAGSESDLDSNYSIRLLDSLTTNFYDTLDVMGWEFVDEGFKVLFSRDIPSIVRECVKPNIEEFLGLHNLSLENVSYHLTHPGGLKVINAYQESLGLSNDSLDNTRRILRNYGNMSSASVLFVINDFLYQRRFRSGKYGLISALGPGFSSELLLFFTN